MTKILSISCPVCYNECPSKAHLTTHIQGHIDDIKAAEALESQQTDSDESSESHIQAAQKIEIQNKSLLKISVSSQDHFVQQGQMDPSTQSGSNFDNESQCGVKNKSGTKRKYHETAKQSCPYCPAVFDNRRMMLLHKAIHDETKFLGCPVCAHMFSRKQDLIPHVKQSLMNLKLRKPRICENLDKNKSRISDPHKESDSETTQKFTCTFCTQSFPELKIMELHKALHKENTFLGCPVCYKMHPNKEQLSDHVQKHLDNITDLIDLSQIMEVVSVEKAQNRGKQYTDVTDFSFEICLLCPVWMENSCKVELHKPYHIDPDALSCPDCNIKLPKDKLRNHVSENHLTNKLLFQCVICSKLFPSRKKQLGHESRHDTKMKLRCKECLECFTHKAVLRDHYIFSHLGIRRFECEICLTKFATRKQLRYHKKSVHEATFGQECNYCGSNYKTKGQLNWHVLRVHSDEINKCPLCNKIFKYKRDLLQHSVVHRETKDFLCDFCGKKFTAWGFLVNHLKKHKNTIIE